MTLKRYQKLKDEIKQELVNEFIAPILSELKDAEDGYKTGFVKGVLRAATEKPNYTYQPKTFTKLINAK